MKGKVEAEKISTKITRATTTKGETRVTSTKGDSRITTNLANKKITPKKDEEKLEQIKKIVSMSGIKNNQKLSQIMSILGLASSAVVDELPHAKLEEKADVLHEKVEDNNVN